MTIHTDNRIYARGENGAALSLEPLTLDPDNTGLQVWSCRTHGTREAILLRTIDEGLAMRPDTRYIYITLSHSAAVGAAQMRARVMSGSDLALPLLTTDADGASALAAQADYLCGMFSLLAGGRDVNEQVAIGQALCLAGQRGPLSTLGLSDLEANLRVVGAARLADRMELAVASKLFSATYGNVLEEYWPEQFICFDLDKMWGMEQQIALYAILYQIWSSTSIVDYRRTVIIVEGLTVLLDDVLAAEFLFRLYRCSRAKGIAWVLMASSVSALRRKPIGRALVAQASHFVLLEQQPSTTVQQVCMGWCGGPNLGLLISGGERTHFSIVGRAEQAWI